MKREKSASSNVQKTKRKFKFADFGENIIRTALDKFEFYKFDNLKKYFPHLKSIREFIFSDRYLGNVEIEISGPKEKIEKLNPEEKLEIALFVIKEIAEQTKMNVSEVYRNKIYLKQK
jgi:type III restriction enzyme